ncbi:MAG: Rnf-Nqr domain containing protein [Nitrospirota bacterium]
MGAELTKLFELFIAASLINNFVFTWFLGLCIFFGVSKKMETAVGMSVTFTAVMVISAALSWLVYFYVMVPLDITFLKIIIFIGIVAAFVLRERLELAQVPRPFRGLPIAFITAALIALAFTGFSGLITL